MDRPSVSRGAVISLANAPRAICCPGPTWRGGQHRPKRDAAIRLNSKLRFRVQNSTRACQWQATSVDHGDNDKASDAQQFSLGARNRSVSAMDIIISSAVFLPVAGLPAGRSRISRVARECPRPSARFVCTTNARARANSPLLPRRPAVAHDVITILRESHSTNQNEWGCQMTQMVQYCYYVVGHGGAAEEEGAIGPSPSVSSTHEPSTRRGHSLATLLGTCDQDITLYAIVRGAVPLQGGIQDDIIMSIGSHYGFELQARTAAHHLPCHCHRGPRLLLAIDMRAWLEKKFTPDQLEKAVESVKNGEKIAVAAKRFGVPRITLHDKISGRTTMGCAMGPSTVLTKEEEDILEKWILALSERHIPLTKDSLLDTEVTGDPQRQQPDNTSTVNTLLDQALPPPNPSSSSSFPEVIGNDLSQQPIISTMEPQYTIPQKSLEKFWE
ncbi:hypothetical protein MSG28_005947 [Choristoneura fumiferana]|uniref:Uncharacterized protein n=1 Tax=Choristoneura fumiferana TaxID=7141 RepID=A0ACC0L1D5_CHOFU|nr:hypothetical protein MSG28_005947 [Choristoneura fumiferana]